MKRPALHVNHPSATARNAPEQPAGERCGSCGAPLRPELYFCAVCATPYRDIEEVLTPAQPAPPTGRQLVRSRAPHAWPLFWWFFATVVATGMLSYLLFHEDRPELGLLFQTAVLALVTGVFAAMHRRALSMQLRRLGWNRAAAWLGVAGLAGLLVVNYVYHGWVLRSLEASDAHPFGPLRDAGLGDASLVLLFCLLPAVMEEIAFRGLLQHWLMTALRPARALVLASALFALLHFSVISAPYLFGVGLLLGWTKWRTGSLYPPVALHFLHNYVVVMHFWT